MKIWTLVENTAPEGLLAEHGLSLYIETAEHRILFDAGQSDAFARNAEALGIDLSLVDLAILSHGHYDHSGGFSRFLERNNHAKVYVNQKAFGSYYNADGRYIGVDPVLRDSGRLIGAADPQPLGQGLTLYTCNDRERLFPADSYGLTEERNGVKYPDTFEHEQYLLVEEAGRRVLFSGCSHKGILNIAHWFRPDILIGGFHFMKQETEGQGGLFLRRAAEALLALPTVYYTGHCTGAEQFQFLREIMGERLRAISGGSVIVL